MMKSLSYVFGTIDASNNIFKPFKDNEILKITKSKKNSYIKIFVRLNDFVNINESIIAR